MVVYLLKGFVIEFVREFKGVWVWGFDFYYKWVGFG